MGNHCIFSSREPLFKRQKNTLYILKNETVSLEETVSSIIQQTNIFPGTVQTDSATIPYLSVKENFELFVSKVYPAERKIDLIVDDLFAEWGVSNEYTRQTFDDLPLDLSLRLQWKLSLLCQKEVIIVDRWIWSESSKKRNEWFQLFSLAEKEHAVTVCLLANQNSPVPFTEGVLHRLNEVIERL